MENIMFRAVALYPKILTGGITRPRANISHERAAGKHLGSFPAKLHISVLCPK